MSSAAGSRPFSAVNSQGVCADESPTSITAESAVCSVQRRNSSRFGGLWM